MNVTINARWLSPQRRSRTHATVPCLTTTKTYSRLGWARALVGIVVAEFFGSFAGFGFAILAAGQTFDTATLLAYVILLGAMGVIGSLIFESAERRLAPWRHE